MSIIEWYNRIFDSSNGPQKILKILFFSHGTSTNHLVRPAHIRLRVRSKYNSMTSIEWYSRIFDSSNCHKIISRYYFFPMERPRPT